jgi:hypothetical protein
MTCTEHLRQRFPEWTDDQIHDYTRSYCPWEVGIDYPPEKVCRHSRCSECWGTDIPEPKKIKKEKKTMPTHDINAREVTKEDLIREIEAAHNHIQEMEKRMRNLDKYNQYKEAGEEIKAMHVAFVDAGFSDEQAFELIKTSIQAAMPSVMRGV